MQSQTKEARVNQLNYFKSISNETVPYPPAIDLAEAGVALHL
jgi:hypothetical protein